MLQSASMISHARCSKASFASRLSLASMSHTGQTWQTLALVLPLPRQDNLHTAPQLPHFLPPPAIGEEHLGQVLL